MGNIVKLTRSEMIDQAVREALKAGELWHTLETLGGLGEEWLLKIDGVKAIRARFRHIAKEQELRPYLGDSKYA